MSAATTDPDDNTPPDETSWWEEKQKFRKFTIEKATGKPKFLEKDEINLGKQLSRIFKESNSVAELNTKLSKLQKEEQDLLFEENGAFAELVMDTGMRRIIRRPKGQEGRRLPTPRSKSVVQVPSESNILVLKNAFDDFLKIISEDQRFKFNELKRAVDVKAEDSSPFVLPQFEQYWKYVDKPELDLLKDDSNGSILYKQAQDLPDVIIMEDEVAKLKVLIEVAYKDSNESALVEEVTKAPSITKLLQPIYDSIQDTINTNLFFYEWLAIDKNVLKKLANETQEITGGLFKGFGKTTQKKYPFLEPIIKQAEKMGFVLENSAKAASASALMFTKGNVRASAKLLIHYHNSRF